MISWNNLCILESCEASLPIKACEPNPVDTCLGNLIKNMGFSIGAIAGNMPNQGNSSNWLTGYGSPEVRTDFGCGDPVYVRLTGNKKIGDTVKADDVLAEVETDKATMEVVGYEDGTLLYNGEVF